MLSSKDMKLASALVRNCLRHQSRLDFTLNGKLTSAEKTPQIVRIILRIGLAQLLFFDRLAYHAVVNETTELAKRFSPGYEGLVNAILRNLIRDKETGPYWPQELDGRDTPAPTRLATLYSHPNWLTDTFIRMWGLREAKALMVANNQATTPTIRINSRLGSLESIRTKFPFETTLTPFSPWGLKPVGFWGKVDHWKSYSEGFFNIQDEASQILPLLAKEPKNILDACAGMGGKTFGLIDAFPQAQVLCLDTNREKLSSLMAEAKRLKAPESIKVRKGDLLEMELAPEFDLVVVDAPCSCLGIIRRRPDIKWKRVPSDIWRFAKLQSELLAAASKAVCPGGQLIYSVCTITLEEGPLVISDFVLNNDDFLLESQLPPVLDPMVYGPGQLLLLPHKHDTDGFYYAVLRKKG
jgi:16S rRNA (cytosine967-C5)-methyltransferase